MYTKENKALGVIGGMGPEATQLFYKMIIDYTDASKDQDHLNMVILNHASMPDRTASILSSDVNSKQLVKKNLIEDATALEQMGCACIAIPCNTSHYFAEDLSREINIPIIHMLRETAKYISENSKAKKVGILATDGTVQTGLYQKELKEYGIESCIPSKDSQKEIMDIIYDIKRGISIELSRINSVEMEMKALGCDKLILGCTELSILKRECNLSDYYVDAMEMLAKAAIVFCGKKLK